MSGGRDWGRAGAALAPGWLHRHRGKFALLAVLVVSFGLTHANLSGTFLDHRNLPEEFRLLDKAYHLVAYSVLSLLVLLCYIPNSRDNPQFGSAGSARRLLVWCACVVAYGLFDECTQPMFGREFEILDLLANAFGIALGLLMFVIAEEAGWRSRFADRD